MSNCIRAGPFDCRSTIFRWRVDSLTSSFLDISDVGLKDENLTGHSWSSEIFSIGENGDRCFLTLQQLFDPTNGNCFGGVRCFPNYLDNENQWQKAHEFRFQFAGETEDYRTIYCKEFDLYPELIWSASKLEHLKSLGLAFISCTIRPIRQNAANDWEPMPGLPGPTRLALEVADPLEPPFEFRLPAIGAVKEKIKVLTSKKLEMDGHWFKIGIKSLKLKSADGADFYEYTATLHNDGERMADAWSCTAWLEVQRTKWNVKSHKNERILRPFEGESAVLWQSAGPANALREFLGIGDVHLCVTFRPLYADLPTVGPPSLFSKLDDQMRNLKIGTSEDNDEEQVKEALVDENNNEKKDEPMQEDDEKWTTIELDAQSIDITPDAEELSKPQALKRLTKFAAIRNVFARFSGKSTAEEDKTDEVPSRPSYDDFDQKEVEKQVAQVAEEFNVVLNEIRANKQRHWFILEHPGTIIPNAKLVEPEVAVSRLPATFRISHLVDVLKLCRFDECPLTHVVMNVACGFVSTFEKSNVDAEQEFKTVLKQTVECFKSQIPTFKSAAVLVCPASPQFERLNNIVNATIEREIRNLNNYVFEKDTIQFMRFAKKENEKPEVFKASWMNLLDVFLEK